MASLQQASTEPDGPLEPFVNVLQDVHASGELYACPCCYKITLPSRGSFELCGECDWEDDGQDDHDADRVRGGPNGDLSLTAARQLYQARTQANSGSFS